jgi:hypothetical protein
MIPRDNDRIKQPIALSDSAIEAILEGIQINPSRMYTMLPFAGRLKLRLKLRLMPTQEETDEHLVFI